ncbi:hypothetical protein UG55_10398 [Frankia sp. EI5c]|nr:hypothetical protein UG55_10398 [Frankia sp. EI5c]
MHVADVAQANLLALGLGPAVAVPGRLRAFNIGSGQPNTIGEVARQLSRACGGPPPVVTGRYRAADVRHIVASSALAGRVLGYTPTVDLAAGIDSFASAPLRA